MTMTKDDLILAASRGDKETFLRYASAHGAQRPDFLAAYAIEVFARCAQAGTPDAAVVLAQSDEETGHYTSSWWVERGNPAGIGVTGDPAQDARSPTFATGEEAARGQVSHLILYATGNITRAGLGPADDPRYAAYRAAYGNTVQATTVDGLSGKWAADKAYGTKIAAHGNAIWPSLPEQTGKPTVGGPVVFGRVPFPPCQIRDIGTPPNTAWDNLGPRTIRSVVYHRMLGSLNGTDGFFRGEGAGSALTDFGMGVAAQDGAALAGVLYRWNDPLGRRSPWSSGPVSNAYGDGAKFVERYGINGVNRDTTSIEISGFQTTPLDPKARATIAAWTAYWADQYRVSYETFPLIPGEGGRSFVIWHQEFTIGTGKQCPFQTVMGETDTLITLARRVLLRYQDGGTATPTTTARPGSYPQKRIPAPDVIKAQGHDLTINASGRFRCIQGTTFRTAPSRDAPAGTTVPAKAGRTYTLPYATTVGGEAWLVSSKGSWALASAFEPAGKA